MESVRDRVLFRVSAGVTVSREFEFDIRLLPQHYWEPLEVTKNSPIIVDESTTIAVTKQYLEVKIISKVFILILDANRVHSNIINPRWHMLKTF